MCQDILRVKLTRSQLKELNEILVMRSFPDYEELIEGEPIVLEIVDDTEIIKTDADNFSGHLKKCAEEVKTWPNWKRCL